MSWYVAMDIGCLECGEESAVLGVFSFEDEAQAVCEDHQQRQSEHWSGQHSMEVFEIPSLNVQVRREYEA